MSKGKNGKQQKRDKKGKFAPDVHVPALPPVDNDSVRLFPLMDPLFAAKHRLADLQTVFEEAKRAAPATMSSPDLYVWSRMEDAPAAKTADRNRRLAAADFAEQSKRVWDIGDALHDEALQIHMRRYPEAYELELALSDQEDAVAEAEMFKYQQMRARMRARLDDMVRKEEARYAELSTWASPDRIALASATEDDDDFYILLQDRDPKVREALAGNPNCEDGDLDFVLARDPVKAVVDAAVRNRNATSYTWDAAKFGERLPLSRYTFPPDPADFEAEFEDEFEDVPEDDGEL